MKKSASIFLAVMLCFLFGVTCFAADSEEEETGNLEITYVTENNESDEFEVTLYMTKNIAVNDRYYGNFNGTYDTNDGRTVTFSDGIAYLSLKSKESITIYDLPTGVYYIWIETYGYSYTNDVAYAIISSGSTTSFTVNGYDNSYSIPVSVVWLDELNAERPKEIEVNIFAHVLGEESSDMIYASLNEENSWTITFDNIVDMNQYETLDIGSAAFFYDGRWQYTYEITGDNENGYIITCTQILDTATSVQVVWNDNDDQDEVRPWSVTISLLMNGEVITHSTAERSYYWEDDDGNIIYWGNDWLAEFAQFEYYSSEEIERNYTISVTDVDGYTYSIEGSFEDGYTVTYTLLSLSTSTGDENDESQAETTETGVTDATSEETGDTEIGESEDNVATSTDAEITTSSSSISVSTADIPISMLISMIMLLCASGFMIWKISTKTDEY